MRPHILQAKALRVKFLLINILPCHKAESWIMLSLHVNFYPMYLASSPEQPHHCSLHKMCGASRRRIVITSPSKTTLEQRTTQSVDDAQNGKSLVVFAGRRKVPPFTIISQSVLGDSVWVIRYGTCLLELAPPYTVFLRLVRLSIPPK